MLPLRIAARGIGVALRYDLPERLCDVEIARRVHGLSAERPVMQGQIAVERAKDLGDRGIGVLVFQAVFFPFEHGVEKRFLVENVRGEGVFGLTRDRIQGIKAVVHAAVFDGQHAPLRFAVPSGNAREHPAAEGGSDFFRTLRTRQKINVAQPRDEFMHRIPGHPRLAHDVGFARFHVVELRLGAARRGQRAPDESLPAPAVFLTVGKRFGYVLRPLQEQSALVFGRRGVGIRLGERRHVVPEGMPRNEGIFPPAVTGKGRGQPRVFVKPRKEPALFQRKQIRPLLGIGVARILVFDRHVFKRECRKGHKFSLRRAPTRGFFLAFIIPARAAFVKPVRKK